MMVSSLSAAFAQQCTVQSTRQISLHATFSWEQFSFNRGSKRKSSRCLKGVVKIPNVDISPNLKSLNPPERSHLVLVQKKKKKLMGLQKFAFLGANKYRLSERDFQSSQGDLHNISLHLPVKVKLSSSSLC